MMSGVGIHPIPPADEETPMVFGTHRQRGCSFTFFLIFMSVASAPAFAQNWSFDARRIALGGVGTAENIASRTAQEERGYRAIVLPFGLFQVLPHWNVFDPTGDEFNPVCAAQYAASPLHYTIGRKACDSSEPGASFVNDIVNARLSRDLTDYRGFRPESAIVAEGLANPSWGKTFAVARDAAGSLVHGIYVGGGPYFSIQSRSLIDPSLIDVFANSTAVVKPNNQYTAESDATTQMAMAITGGYRGRLPILNTGDNADGVYVAANYHYLRGFHLDQFDLVSRFETNSAGLLTLVPTTPPVTIDRVKSNTGTGFALDFGAAVAMRGWTLGFGASGVANRIEWDELERERFDLLSLSGGGDFRETDLPAPTGKQRVELPVNYTGSLGYRAERWSVESEYAHGYQGNNFHGGLEYRLGVTELRGGARYSRNKWHPSGGAGFNFTPRFGVDVAAFGTSANFESRRDVAIAVSLRITPEDF
jgi:hypothetical protein